MANAVKGEADIQIGNKKYTLVITMHAYALAQDALTKGVKVPTLDEIGKRLEAGHALTAIAMFWAALQKYHPEFETLEQATELMEKASGNGATALAEAIKRAVPDQADVREAGGAPKNPQGAQDATRGTGEISTSAPAPSA